MGSKHSKSGERITDIRSTLHHSAVPLEIRYKERDEGLLVELSLEVGSDISNTIYCLKKGLSDKEFYYKHRTNSDPKKSLTYIKATSIVIPLTLDNEIHITFVYTR